ncbi:MAG TPA: hypothetical protein VMS17_00565 [Gemmataceae bacterium]|nr:hypothetical protein [Gemmataceae bacterium]
MGNFRLTDLGDMVGAIWPLLLIGLGTASLAFVLGWTASRRRYANTAAPKDRVTPDEADGQGPANDRRAAGRRGGHPVTVHMTDPDEKAQPQTGWVVDRSVGGLCLMIRQPVPVGSFWKVRPTDAPRTTPPVLVEVKTCVLAGDEWKLNCRFQRTPSYGSLLMFG